MLCLELFCEHDINIQIANKKNLLKTRIKWLTCGNAYIVQVRNQLMILVKQFGILILKKLGPKKTFIN